MKKGVVTALIVLAVLAAGGYWLAPETEPESTPAPPTAAANGEADADTPPAERATLEQPRAPTAPEPKPGDPAAEPQAQAAPEPEGFCARDFDDIETRTADVDALEAAGGLVHIFEREARLEDPYGCADFYLAQGLDVDAIDPRADREALTGLHFAIQRNDPKMLRFMIEHGADLKKRAGEKDVKPLGYAYYLALNDTRIDRNAVIGILDTELTKQAASQ